MSSDGTPDPRYPDVDPSWGGDDAFRELMQSMIDALKKTGIAPCARHRWMSMNPDGTCEACRKADFPDDWHGTE